MKPLGDIAQGHRLELAAPADGFLVERDRLFGGLPSGGELIQATLAMEVLHRGNAAGVDVRAQVPPYHELLQGQGQLLVGLAPELGRNVLWPQMHDEALLRPCEGEQQAPVKAGVRDAQVCERLRLALVTRRLGESANHRNILLYAAGRMYAIRRSLSASPRPIPNQEPSWDHRSPSPLSRQLVV